MARRLALISCERWQGGWHDLVVSDGEGVGINKR